MEFKIGDKVKIILSEQVSYSAMYNLTANKGVVSRVKDGIIYINFNNSIERVAVLSKDLELAVVKGEQLLFDFMEQ